MWEKVGRKPVSIKNWVAYSMFAAIIVVFIFWGVHSENYQVNSGGVAAVVNDQNISIAEFRQRAENAEATYRQQIEQVPAAQRQGILKEVRKRALDELIFGELMYQDGQKKGFVAVDPEVRDYILDISFLKENGRFVRERYDALLANLRFSSDEFETQIRKQLVAQKMQGLLVGAMQPSTFEIEQMQKLKENKLNIRFAQINRDDLQGKGFVSDADAATFMQNSENAKAIEKYYADNKIQYTSPEQVEARHILVSINEKRNEADALKLVNEIKAKAKVENFSQLATEFSDDPGSKKKGGALDAFGRGRMIPEFEKVAFELAPGKISDPVKTFYGFHIILVDKKLPSKTRELAEVKEEIARKLVARSQSKAIVEKINGLLAAGQTSEVEGMITKAGLKFEETGEFDLSNPAIPKIGDNSDFANALTAISGKTGWLPKVVDSGDSFIVAQVTSWKKTDADTKDLDTLRRSMTYRKSAQFMEAWSKEVEAKASIVKNDRLLQ